MGFNLITCVSVAFVAWLVYYFILYPVIFSPLAKIPAPHWSCHISPLWILLARKNNFQNKLLHKAHLKLGPVVRIGPSEMSVDGYDALKTIYQGGFEKDKWYSIFDNYGVPCMFSTLGSKSHSLRKRMISNVYSKSFIHASPAAKAQAQAILFGRLLPLLSNSAAGPRPQGIEAFSTFLASTMDFITAYVYGLRNSTDFLRQKAYRDHWLQLYLVRANYGFWPQEMPRLTVFLGRFGPILKPYPAWVDDANAELGEWNEKLCKRAYQATHGSNTEIDKEDVVDEPVVFRALEAGIEKEHRANGKESLLYSTTILKKDLSMASELLDQVLAGQETAGIALTYLAWHLSKSPSLQQELKEELLTLNPPMRMSADRSSLPALPDPKQVDSLPVLHAIIMETLRLHAPIPGPEPRRTPHPSCQLGGCYVPGGVRVAALGYTLHRNEKVFPWPENWDHTRWLESETTEEQRRHMNRYFWAFGSGGRMCIGSNFAMNEMKFIAAAIWSNFTTHIVDDMGIEQEDAYTARPMSESLILRFERV
ncbi:cytochrome p450 [Colletotrichum truncatum]|uniref:Cytochrome p450 n=1 Tax=Colletotrichum truncatum TaxID=5467 RepID=A0ACC3YQU2_COLTU|nr:cytochrome p450 [Colletotrichum truncatum]KAF6799000.1 cytochrome p450 [Colletotrichum truncatum]